MRQQGSVFHGLPDRVLIIVSISSIARSSAQRLSGEFSGTLGNVNTANKTAKDLVESALPPSPTANQ